MVRDPKMCMRCKYHSFLSGVEMPKEGEPLNAQIKRNIYCDYSSLSGKGTALKRQGADIVDTRGKNPKKCKLFDEGPRKHHKVTYIADAKEGGKQWLILL